MSLSVRKLNNLIQFLNSRCSSYQNNPLQQPPAASPDPLWEMEVDFAGPHLLEDRPQPDASVSALSSLPSTPHSYHTAATGSGLHGDSITDYHSPPPTASQSYKPSRRIPTQASGRIRIYLEDKNYSEALTSLSALLAPGLPDKKRVHVPPSTHLAFVANLAVHPTFTNRLTDTTWFGVADQALDYLHRLLESAGPRPFARAFRFRRVARRRRFPNRDSDYEEAFESDIENDSERIRRNPMATASSIWALGQDFWSVVGWAFMCSSSHPTRWPFWKKWLELILDVLERDWEACLEADESAAGPNEEVNYKKLGGSIFASYMDTEHMYLNGGESYALDAILVGLAPRGSSNRFQAVFHKETNEPDDPNKKRKYSHMRVDVENQIYGGYVDDDDDEDSSGPPSPTPATTHTRYGRRSGGQTSALQSTTLPITSGVLESIPIRLSLFKLVSSACQLLGPIPAVGLNYQELHIKAASAMKQFPFSTLQKSLDFMFSWDADGASPTLISSLLLEAILPKSAKSPYSVDKTSANHLIISQDILEQCYLPYAAISQMPEENARLSIVLEHILYNLNKEGRLEPSEQLRRAVETGISARADRVQGGGNSRMKKKQSAAQPRSRDVGLLWLSESGERLRLFLDFLDVAKFDG
ncbi:hypothetical protein MKZ38_009514 [Zalerion maritima]|uniref:Uncharacterized protein n=1 Tax=Zalerion maritima TaxID=339359 RepID=A0AAD5RUZ7_9PEZI|nr:hypothetical protein MKZ38_009514 [Zalerion maritima]